jgi:hypothetical protein
MRPVTDLPSSSLRVSPTFGSQMKTISSSMSLSFSSYLPPSPHFLLLFSGQQLLDRPFFFLIETPFVPPAYLCFPLHIQCQLFHSFSYLNEILVNLCFNFLLAVCSSFTMLMAFSSHLFLSLALLAIYHLLHTLQPYLYIISTLSSFTFYPQVKFIF